MGTNRFVKTLLAWCAALLIGQAAFADDFHVKLLVPREIGSWTLSEPMIFNGEHERFDRFPTAYFPPTVVDNTITAAAYLRSSSPPLTPPKEGRAANFLIVVNPSSEP